MICPNCMQQLSKVEAINVEKKGMSVLFECKTCGAKLKNHPKADLIRNIGYLFFIVGFLSFGGSWPMPLFPVPVSSLLVCMGVVAFIYWIKVTKFAASR